MQHATLLVINIRHHHHHHHHHPLSHTRARAHAMMVMSIPKGRTTSITGTSASSTTCHKPPADTVRPVAVPVIDLGHLGQRAAARSLAIQDIGRACQTLGCFQVVNHGIHKSVINGALEAASDFFELAENEKTELESGDIRQPVRYGTGFLGNNTKEREFLKHYAHPLHDWIHLWPLTPRDYRERMGSYAVGVRRVALQVMGAILESLGLGEDYLRGELKDGMQVMSVNGYRQNPQPNLALVGMAPHSDYGCITILQQTSAGLHILDKSGTAWMEVPVAPDALHIHIGDHMEVLSNGRYRSLVHRAVLGSRRRVSIASIHGLSMDGKVAAAQGLVDEQHPSLYKESSFRDFLDYISSGKGSEAFIESLKQEAQLRATM